jgi:hypothetical protein
MFIIQPLVELLELELLLVLAAVMGFMWTERDLTSPAGLFAMHSYDPISLSEAFSIIKVPSCRT